jgi:diaminohydroxyphosphoribosylaminopyrimidine deaminase/5-amino-6-(5-phosphoribosylamino)uracil reductase
VICGEGVDGKALSATGAEILPTRLVAGEFWLPAVMEALVARGITRLLIEGGPATWSAFSRAGLVDEAVLFHARGLDGAELSPPAALALLARYVSTQGFDIYDRRTIGGDDMLAVRRHWHRGGHRGRTEAT